LELVFTKPLLSDAVVRTILDISDEFIRREDRVWEFFIKNNMERLDSILMMGLEPLALEDRTARARLISSHPCGITLAASVIDRLAGQHGIYGGEKRHATEQYIGRDIVDELVSKTIVRIRQLARDGEAFLATPQPMRLIWIWRRWTNPEELKSKISEWMKSDSAILRLAEVLPSVSYQSSSDGQKEIRSFKTTNYEPIMDVAEFKARLDIIAKQEGIGSAAEQIRLEFLVAEETGKQHPF
jgi:hypothetical protein